MPALGRTLAVGRRRGTGPASSHRAVLQVLADTFPFGPDVVGKTTSLDERTI